MAMAVFMLMSMTQVIPVAEDTGRRCCDSDIDLLTHDAGLPMVVSRRG
jgi:hypothetical protein